MSYRGTYLEDMSYGRACLTGRNSYSRTCVTGVTCLKRGKCLTGGHKLREDMSSGRICLMLSHGVHGVVSVSAWQLYLRDKTGVFVSQDLVYHCFVKQLQYFLLIYSSFYISTYVCWFGIPCLLI